MVSLYYKDISKVGQFFSGWIFIFDDKVDC